MTIKPAQTAPDWRGERPDNPQLPIYALLRPERLVAVAYGRVNAAKLEFVMESERPDVFKKPGRATKMEGKASFEELIAVWHNRVANIAAGLPRVRRKWRPR